MASSSTPECEKADPADVLFLLDGSGSVGADGFRKSLEFVNKFVDAFSIGPNATQVSLVVYTMEIDSQFYWNAHSTASSLKKAITNTPYNGGGGDMPLAIDYVRKMYQTVLTGRRSYATWITVLMTDGKSYDTTVSINAAHNLKNDGVIIYTAGVGNYTNVDELKQIATNTSYYFTTSNYDSLETISGPITSSACADANRCFCYNGGTCTPSNFGNKCTCPAIFTGFKCHKPICSVSPCKNGGQCAVTGDQWSCLCQPGYTGRICEEDIDECSSNPCVHGNCINGINLFRCKCEPGYTGSLCEEEIDECSSNPCKHSGTCTDHINAFICQCAPGYTGVTCTIDIDECESSPCENGGTCLDRVNGFVCDCPHRYYGFYCETGICQPSVADIVFVLDSSSSQTKEEFMKQLEFVNTFIDHIVIGANNLQIAVITYSFKAVVEVSLGQYKDNVTLKEAVRNIQYRPGATFTDKGLEEAKELFKTASRNRPYGHLANRYVFLLTDGMSNKREATIAAAKNLKKNVNKVLAIGIGKEVSHMELLAIASKENAANGRPYVYSVQNFNALYTVVKELVRLTCDECSWQTSSDIVFLLDMSSTISTENFQTGLNAITYLTHKAIEMETENNTVRIALATYGAEIKLRRALNDLSEKHTLLSYIQGLVHGYCDSVSRSCEAVKLDAVFRFVDRHVFNDLQSDESDNREIVILLSDGQEDVTEATKTEVENFKRTGRSIYAVALGEKANTENLQAIVGDPARVFSVYDDSTLIALDALTTEFFFSNCDLTNDFLDGN